jgi:catechol 2,3-dioxygenase
MSSNAGPRGPSVNHLVVTVRDIEASHRFYTEVIGFERCGELRAPPPIRMWFYRGSPEAHHDFALVQQPADVEVPPARPWSGFFDGIQPGINHIAIGYPTREEWLDRLRIIEEAGVEFVIRGNHGMTHSAYVSDPDGNGVEVLYDLPPEVWEGDIDAALSHFEPLPSSGPEAFEDSTDYVRFGS